MEENREAYPITVLSRDGQNFLHEIKQGEVGLIFVFRF